MTQSAFAQRLRKQARHASLESGKLPMGEGVPTDEDGVPTDTGETADAMVAETSTLQEAADDAVAEVDESVAAVDTLDNVAEAIEQQLRSGNYMDAFSARMTHVAIESAVRKLGGKSSEVLPAVESFTSSNARMRTEAALEGVKETAKAFWAWIKEQVNKAWAWVKNWYLKTLDTATRLKKKIEAVKKRAEDTEGTISSDNKKMELGLNSALHINKKPPTVSQLTEHVGHMKTVAGNLAGKTSESFNSIAEKMADIAETGEGKGAAALNALVGVKTMEGATGTATNVEDALTGKYQQTKQGPLTFGGQVFVFAAGEKVAEGGTVPSDADFAALDKVLFLYGYESAKGIKDVEGKAEFETVPASTVADVCDTLLEAVEFVIKYKATWEARGKTADKMKSGFDKAEKAYDKASDTDKESTKTTKAAAKAALKAFNAQTRGDGSIIGFVISKSNSVLNLCSASLNKHGKD